MKSLFQTALFAAVFAAALGNARADTILVPAGATWKYHDLGFNPGTGWNTAAFSDTAWSTGAAELGYGDGDEATVVGYGPSATTKYITTYFRRGFEVTAPSSYTALRLRLIRDDGVVVYLNGTEVKRDNMPAGTIAYSTLASTALGAPAENTWVEFTLPATALQAGTNLLAVELHQGTANSSDLSLNAELTGLTGFSVTRGPYLQMASPTAMNLRWRTSAATESVVRYGPAAGSLTQVASVAGSTTEHEVRLTGLQPNTAYFYSVGNSAGALAGDDAQHFFYTPPVTGPAQASRFWVIGDCGTGTANQANVRDAFLAWNTGNYTDLILALGDNAYDSGTDAEYQAKFFNVYAGLLRQTPLFSTIGNHETAQSTNPALTIPYFQSFTFPTAGECGGVPSGTEKYYSFDHANIHFVCLDTMSSGRTGTSAMATWLQQDLALTTRDWIVAFFHHPPYTKGSHDSDAESDLVAIRANLMPILEAGGVDLVLTGHSHAYERSRLIAGHYGLSSSFDPATMLKDGGDGSESGDGAYAKPAGISAVQGAVYVVAGHAGKATNWTGGSTADTNPAPHPVMEVSYLRRGSLVMDVNGNRLDVIMLRDNGSVDDRFTLLKDSPNTPPQVALVSPADGTSLTAPATLVIEAAASDTDGSVVQMDFYADGLLLGTDVNPPFALIWTEVPAGSYSLTAVALDDKGATTVSAAVGLTVTAAPPAAPSGVVASAVPGSISVSWQAVSGATSYAVFRSAAGGAYSLVAGSVTTPGYTDTAVTAGVTYCYQVTATGASGTSGFSAGACATAPAVVTLAAPGNLRTTSVAKTKVGLAWTDNSANETGFQVYRSLDQVTWTLVSTVGANKTTYSAGGLKARTTYSFRVRAINATTASAYSNTLTVTTPAR